MAKKKEQVDVEQLREELLICRKNGYQKLSDDRVKKADAFCEDYKVFLDHSKTEREAVKSAILRAEKEGFVAFDPKKTYKAAVHDLPIPLGPVLPCCMLWRCVQWPD